MTLLQTIIVAIVEGLTEFLPVSSTGHMIITQNLLGVNTDDAFVHAFTFIIQFGAILSVVVLYWNRFFKFDNTPAPEGSSLFQRLKHKYRFYWLLFIGANQVTEKRAFRIGLYQCISVIPGVSRSMATIVGGMTQGLTRKRAAEFSFFLAVPTMAGATLLDLLDLLKEESNWATAHNITMLIVGCVVAFVVALLAMKWFVNFLSKYGFKAFGVYRIIVGGIIIALLLAGQSLAMVD